MSQIIKAPLITEKNTIHQAAGVYVFEVDKRATKTEIKAAVEKSFNVKVDSVRTVNARGRGKINRFGRTAAPHWKKAFVKLRQGEKIALFEG
ncbi:MAG: 50S ribosomal protein L23, partial [Bdellovibrionaceae bacterium]|nr:50S ribosomal protein L23 [Pseudobdellovibrionaceae bacterium]